MRKAEILLEIKRTAEANGGVPLGVERFLAETGIKESDWRGRYWLRWGDALQEAGFSPNILQGAYDADVLIRRFIDLIREVRRYPLQAEIRMKRRSDTSFPSHNVFRRFGTQDRFAKKIIDFCDGHQGFEDVPPLIAGVQAKETDNPEPTGSRVEATGFVYLLKSGPYFKIGRTNAAGRRERELSIQLPEKAKAIHVIKTDDPSGIEAYWHSRFSRKRLNGEWFDLDAADVAAFKRRKFQ
jgi:hypothetical protein